MEALQFYNVTEAYYHEIISIVYHKIPYILPTPCFHGMDSRLKAITLPGLLPLMCEHFSLLQNYLDTHI